MRLFDSAWIYVLLFCVLMFITVEKLHQLATGAIHSDSRGLNVERVMVTLVTVVMAGYMPILIRRTSNRLEQVGIVLTELLCVLWFATLLASQGAEWAQIPHSAYLSAALNCAITLIAGVRVFQV
jgi:hypothetical protein